MPIASSRSPARSGITSPSSLEKEERPGERVGRRDEYGQRLLAEQAAAPVERAVADRRSSSPGRRSR